MASTTPSSLGRRPAVLMIAYTNYESDPRVIREAEAAAEAGFDVDFIALRRGEQPDREVVNGVTIHRVRQQRYRGASRPQYLFAYFEFLIRSGMRATRLHLRRRYGAVHVNNMPDLLVFAAIIPKLLGAKVVLDIHDPMPETFGAKFTGTKGKLLARLMVAAESISVGFCDAVVTVNELVKQGILIPRGYRAEDITVVANFADDNLFVPGAYPKLDGVLQMVFHGTILERYGLRTLIEALGKLRRRDRVRVRIIGEGDFSQTLRTLIRANQVEDLVEFDNRLYPLRQIPAKLADCHVGLVPLDLTSVAPYALPLKLIEYTCLGLPSITVRSPAIMHYLTDDECVFYATGDASALAAAIDRLVDQPSLLTEYRRRVEAARPRVSWSTEKAKYVALLRELTGQPTVRNAAVSEVTGVG